MKVTIYGYKESFLFTPSVKVYQDGRLLGVVKAKNVLVLEGIEENSILTFKSGIRSTECVVSNSNIILSFNRMIGCLEAHATDHVDQTMLVQSMKDHNNVLMAVIIVLVLVVLYVWLKNP